MAVYTALKYSGQLNEHVDKNNVQQTNAELKLLQDRLEHLEERNLPSHFVGELAESVAQLEMQVDEIVRTLQGLTTDPGQDMADNTMAAPQGNLYRE